MSAFAWLTLWGSYGAAIALTLAYLAFGDNVRGFVPTVRPEAEPIPTDGARGSFPRRLK